MTKPSQRVIQNPHIHGCVILMPWALLPSRWAFGLVWLHGHIVARPQMLYQVVFGCIRCITPINPPNKFGPIPCPMGHPLWQLGEKQPHLKPNNNNNKPNARINRLDESYFLHDESIA